MKTPKRGYPTVPDDVLGCLERAFTASRVPRVVVDPGAAAARATFHLEVH